MLPGLHHPAKLNEIISRVLVVRRDPRGMLLLFQNPSIFQPLVKEHPPLPTQKTPPPRQCPRKGRSSPLFQFSLLSVIFPTNHQSQAACPHTLGWGATPGSPTVGISLPEPWPGRRVPQRRQREKWVCVHSRMQGARAARPPALGILGPARSPHLAPPAGRCRRR